YAEARDAYAVPDPRGGIVTECLALVAAAQLHGHVAAGSLRAEREALRRLASLERRDSTGCAATSLAVRAGYYDSDPPEAMAHLRRAAALAPEVADNWLGLANRLAGAPHPDRADVEATLAEGLRHVPHPLQRAKLFVQLISLRLGWNDTAGARRLTAALLPALARDGRPGLRLIAWELGWTGPWRNQVEIPAYTAAGRWPEAAAAADSFVALTRPMRYEPLRMMSLHDAGMIRWKAGWHAAAAANFAEMVRVVDDEQNVANYYWAGEYFERTGDLARA